MEGCFDYHKIKEHILPCIGLPTTSKRWHVYYKILRGSKISNHERSLGIFLFIWLVQQLSFFISVLFLLNLWNDFLLVVIDLWICITSDDQLTFRIMFTLHKLYKNQFWEKVVHNHGEKSVRTFLKNPIGKSWKQGQNRYLWHAYTYPIIFLSIIYTIRRLSCKATLNLVVHFSF